MTTQMKWIESGGKQPRVDRAHLQQRFQLGTFDIVQFRREY